MPFATAVAVLIGVGLLRVRAAREALPDGDDQLRPVRHSLLICIAALVALVIARFVILISFEFRITPLPPEDKLVAEIIRQLAKEILAVSASLIPAAILFFVTWPSNTHSRAEGHR